MSYHQRWKDAFVTVIEHAHYLKKAERLLSAAQVEDIANALAADPRLGEVMRGTGGFRKFRYAGVKNRGKSGGMRVNLYVANNGEVHLIDIFKKSARENLTRAERNELAKIAALLKGGKS